MPANSITGNTPAPQTVNLDEIKSTLSEVCETIEVATHYISDVAEYYQNKDDSINARYYQKLSNNVYFDCNPVYNQLSILHDGEPITPADLAELAQVAENTAEVMQNLGYELSEIENDSDIQSEVTVYDYLDPEQCHQIADDLLQIASDIKGGN